VSYIEFDVRANPLRDKLLVTRLEPRDGYLKLHEGPGLGVEINRNALASSVSNAPENTWIGDSGLDT
jgi:L-alanine-DL-glutamate epimerase-like enolase superfamily enzyme